MIIAKRTNMSETREETEFLKRKMLSDHLGEIEGKPFKFTKKMNDCGYGIDIILETISDVVEVVRCKDCKHLTVINNESAYARCEKTGYIFWSFRTDTREHFCAYGERREG